MSKDFIALNVRPTKRLSRDVQLLDFLKNDPTPQGDFARARLNHWIRCWNHDDQHQILGKLSDRRVESSQGALWELYVNALLRWLHCEVQRVHEIPSVSTPDFLVTYLGEEFYVECTTVQMSHLTKKHEERVNLFLDYLDSRSHAQYCLGVIVKCEGVTSIKSKSFADQVFEWLNQLNPTFGDYKSLTIAEADWIFEFLSVPRIGNGMRTVQLSMISTVSAMKDDIKLRKSIKTKSSKYKSFDVEKPLILFIQEDEKFIGEPLTSRASALLGDSQIQFNPQTGASNYIRKPNGAWTSKNGLINKTTSAVSISSYVSLWSPRIKTPQIWVHAEPRVRWCNLFDFPTYKVTGSSMYLHEGVSDWDGVVPGI